MASVNAPEKPPSSRRAAPGGSSTGQRVPLRSGHNSNTTRTARTGPDQGACDQCYRLKVKCERDDPNTKCNRCQEHNVPCTRSLGRRPPGKPKGSKNKPKIKVGDALQRASSVGVGHDGTISIEFASPKRQTTSEGQASSAFELKGVLEGGALLNSHTHASSSGTSLQSLGDWRGQQQSWDTWTMSNMVPESYQLASEVSMLHGLDLIPASTLTGLAGIHPNQPTYPPAFKSDPQTPVSDINPPMYSGYISQHAAIQTPTSHPSIKQMEHSNASLTSNVPVTCTEANNTCLCNPPIALEQISALQPLLPHVSTLDEPLTRAQHAKELLQSSFNCSNFQSYLSTSILGGSNVPLQMCLLLINVLFASYKKINEAGPSFLTAYPVEWACIKMTTEVQKRLVFDRLVKKERGEVETYLLKLEQWSKSGSSHGNTTSFAQIQAVKVENGL